MERIVNVLEYEEKDMQCVHPKEWTELNYMPNVTCPYCGSGTETDYDLFWQGWGLTVTQRYPECNNKWLEKWHLTSLEGQK
jgi:hypothetical protein